MLTAKLRKQFSAVLRRDAANEDWLAMSERSESNGASVTVVELSTYIG